MAKKITKDVASRLLSDVATEKGFYLNNGTVLKNIVDFNRALTEMNDEQFGLYRNQSKNDFYNWIINVIGDAKLANDIARAKTKQTMLKKVSLRVDQLSKIRDGK